MRLNKENLNETSHQILRRFKGAVSRFYPCLGLGAIIGKFNGSC